MGNGVQANLEKWIALAAEVRKTGHTGKIEIDTKDGGLIGADFKFVTRRKADLSHPVTIT